MKSIKQHILLLVLVAFSVSTYAITFGTAVEPIYSGELSLPAWAFVFGTFLMLLGRSKNKESA